MKGMKLFFLLPVLFFISCNNTPTDYHRLTNDKISNVEKEVAASADKFGLKLFKQVNKVEGDTNIFISPLSVSIALGMTLNGANGTTYDQMKSTLELNGLSEKEINQAYEKLVKYLISVDPKVALSIANSIWYRNTYQVEQSFLDINKKYFNAIVSGLDFDDPNSIDVINQWVSDNTNSLIDKILEEQIDPDVIMYLINAVYFKGNWKYQFSKEATKADKFYLSDGNSKDCGFMNQKNTFNYLSNGEFKAVQLPYGDEVFNMTVFLPSADIDINGFINSFNEETWSSWNSSFKPKEGNLWLPKFKLEYKLEMKDVLASMGMPVAFSDDADFTRINSRGGLYISKVLHKSFITADEEGTEAAAATSVEIKLRSGGDNGEFFMKVNRPFIFVISEKETGSILFIGKVVKP